MDLNALPCLDGGPLLAELLHHLLPDEERLIGELIDALLRLLLELIEAEAALNHCGLLHEEFEVSVGNARLMRAPVLLNDCSGQNRAFLSLEHHRGDLDARGNLILVHNTVV